MFITYSTIFTLISIILFSTIYILVKESIHPMIMLFMLILFTLSNTLYVSKWFSSYFFSYLMFMVFIGGILITFLYLVSLTNMDKYNIKLSLKNKIIIYSSSISSMMFLAPYTFFSLTTNLENFKTMELVKLNINSNEVTLFIESMYSHSFLLTIISILVLLFMLISVIKICSKHSGPLRQVKKSYEKILNKN